MVTVFSPYTHSATAALLDEEPQWSPPAAAAKEAAVEEDLDLEPQPAEAAFDAHDEPEVEARLADELLEDLLSSPQA